MILNTLQMGEGPPLVLLHGLFGSARNLGMLSRGLSDKARVIAMDLRNHGGSPHGLPMDFVTMAGDVAETLAHLGIARVYLAGHSLGGKTAMALTLTRPDLVARLAVLDIAPIAYRHEEYGHYVAAMLALPLHPGLTRAEADKALAQTVKAAPLRAFLLSNLVLGENPHWRVGLKEIQAAMPDLLNWVDPPGCRPFAGPTLFLAGAESDYIGPEAEPAIKRLFPHAVCRQIAGAAHWLHADKPAEVLASLREFFGL